MKGALLVLLAVFTVSHAHLCMLYPHQRGSSDDLNKMGADDCKLLTGPCGGRMDMTPMVNFMPGMNGTIIFQKNLDHFNTAMPGKFQINFWVGTKMTTLMEVPDSNTPSGYLYEVAVKMPDMEVKKAILQVIYITSNPQAPAMFYQCADVSVMKM